MAGGVLIASLEVTMFHGFPANILNHSEILDKISTKYITFISMGWATLFSLYHSDIYLLKVR